MDRKLADAAAVGAGQTLRVHLPGGSTFMREITSWQPTEKYSVKSKTDSIGRCVFPWRTFLTNFIPIRFETTEPWTFWRGRPNRKNNNKMSKGHKGRYSSSWGELYLRAIRDVTCHIGSHSVTCHTTQVNATRLTPAMQAATWFTYPGGMEGWVDLVDLITPRLRVELATFRSRVWRPTTAPPRQWVLSSDKESVPSPIIDLTYRRIQTSLIHCLRYHEYRKMLAVKMLLDFEGHLGVKG